MRQITVNAARWSQDSEGAWLCLRVKSPEAAMEVCDALKQGKEYTATIKGKGRSLDVNAYAWVLLDKLAAHYGVSREKVYRQEIQSIGGVSEVLCLREKAAEAFCRSWGRYRLDDRYRPQQNQGLRKRDRLVRQLRIRHGADGAVDRRHRAGLPGCRH